MAVRFGAACAAALLLVGCVTRTPAAADRMADPAPAPRLAEDAWPAWTPTPEPIAVTRGGESLALACRGTFGSGQLYTAQWPGAAGPGAGGPVVIGTARKPVVTIHGAGRARRGSMLYVYAMQSVTVADFESPDGTRQQLQLLGVEPSLMALDAQRPLREPVRGTIVLLTSLAGFSSTELALIDAFRKRGWSVITCSPPFDTMARRRYSVDGDGRCATVAADVAGAIDRDLSQPACAVEGMLGYLAAQDPGLVRDPMVAVGCSAGAISLPALVARMPGRFRAAVLVGGGADVFQVITRSDLMGSRMRIQWDGRSPTTAQMRQLHDAVLDRSDLDPYHTAALLAGMPVLMVQARFDRIVPAATGDILYERLGRPERWSVWAGHLGMFWWLPHESGRIADWVDRAIAAEPPSATPGIP